MSKFLSFSCIKPCAEESKVSTARYTKPNSAISICVIVEYFNFQVVFVLWTYIITGRCRKIIFCPKQWIKYGMETVMICLNLKHYITLFVPFKQATLYLYFIKSSHFNAFVYGFVVLNMDETHTYFYSNTKSENYSLVLVLYIFLTY